jgi:hypothetical protein
VKVLYARQPLLLMRRSWPRPWIFLAGPTPRTPEHPSWRPDVIKEFEARGFEGTLIVPEDEDRADFREEFLDEQVPWEWQGLEAADCIMFWCARNMATMPGMTTNVEFGLHARDGKIVLGCPIDGENNGYLKRVAERFGITVCESLDRCIHNSIQLADQRYRRGYSVLRKVV